MTLKRRIIDRVLATILAIPLRLLKRIRFTLHQFPYTRAMLRRVGVFLITDHYYEPLIDPTGLSPLDQPRDLPGIDFNRAAQVALLESFAEDTAALAALRTSDANRLGFDLANGLFEHGDAELWFQMIRHCRPRRIIEIGAGHSTKVAILALDYLRAQDTAYHCAHVCIEPYAPDWLGDVGPEIIAAKLEAVPLETFAALMSGDILFIDSSHVIRPQGDVLQAYLRILPTLAPGVVVHIHDMFSPRDYPPEWVQGAQYFWNEQYLVEAFLSHNCDWEIMIAGNMMFHEQRALVEACCPFLDPAREPRSLYIRRTVAT